MELSHLSICLIVEEVQRRDLESDAVSDVVAAPYRAFRYRQGHCQHSWKEKGKRKGEWRGIGNGKGKGIRHFISIQGGRQRTVHLYILPPLNQQNSFTTIIVITSDCHLIWTKYSLTNSSSVALLVHCALGTLDRPSFPPPQGMNSIQCLVVETVRARV